MAHIWRLVKYELILLHVRISYIRDPDCDLWLRSQVSVYALYWNMKWDIFPGSLLGPRLQCFTTGCEKYDHV